ncbi:type I secretion system protein [Staphylococcus gallinarum]|uniref:type I secretion system protein n=1 Tax=Staphylococcus gallinarum TaxID=1293 RepID=UPI001E5589FB|nr:type I secretion system protein [Staphylococcus gallinarum]MCD8918934.1 type I secretion system protein [Staphylococcus gallinarum]
MSEFIAALIGGIFSLIGTFSAIFIQFRKEDKEKSKEYQNDLVSMIDIITYKAAKVRNNELNFNHSFNSKLDTGEIYIDIERDAQSLDHQIQDLITMMSHHIENSNGAIQELLGYYEQVEQQFNKFKIAYKIYNQHYEDEGFDTNAITFSKRKLDIAVGEFINNLGKLAKKLYEHEVYKPNLNSIINREKAIKIKENS